MKQFGVTSAGRGEGADIGFKRWHARVVQRGGLRLFPRRTRRSIGENPHCCVPYRDVGYRGVEPMLAPLFDQTNEFNLPHEN
jgi:hypothetical protein